MQLASLDSSVPSPASRSRASAWLAPLVLGWALAFWLAGTTTPPARALLWLSVPVLACAWVGGRRVTLAAAAASLVLRPWSSDQATISAWPEWAAFCAVTLGAAWLLHALRSQRSQLREHEQAWRARDASDAENAKLVDQLALSEERFRLLVEAANDDFFLHDAEGRFLGVNAQTCKTLGYTREELLTMSVDDIAPLYGAEEARATWAATSLGSSVRVDSQHRRKDGSFVPVEVQITCYAVRDRKLFFVLARDISERLRAESAARNFAAQLEARVEQRTAQLAAANQELEAFSYSVSHDLRAPLRAIDGFAMALAEDLELELSDDAKTQVQRIRDRAARMSTLIDSLLTLSVLGRQHVTLREVGMQQMVAEVVQEQRSSNPGRDLEFQVAQLPVCVGDPELLRQVWTNLLSNAVKYSRLRRHAVVSVGATITDDEIEYFVRDNGAGFDMAHASKLFSVFHRLHHTSEYEGTGAGLAIVQRIVHRHGGQIWADARPEQGATFTFSLPRVARRSD